MAKINERHIALKIIEDINTKELFANKVIDDYFFVYELEKTERGFISRLVYGVIENQLYLDFIINLFSTTKTTKMKPLIQYVLRMGVYQLLFMDKVPTHAAISESVDLVKKRKFNQLTGFVNGVLRKVDRSRNTIDLTLNQMEDKAYLSTKYSMLEQTVGYLLKKQYTKEQLEAILKASMATKDTCLRINGDEKVISNIKAELQKDYQLTEGNLLRECVYLSGYDVLDKVEIFTKGYVQVQDESSALVAYVAIDGEEKSSKLPLEVLDVCSAPGGKSIHLASLMGDKCHIVACDMSESKIEKIKENIKRLQVEHIETRIQDGTSFVPEFEQKFDVVLCDVPCSGLGVIRSKPDIKLNMTVARIKALIDIQREIVANSKRYVKPNGTLIYSTCTFNKKENEEQVAWFLSENPEFELLDISQIFIDSTKFNSDKIKTLIEEKMFKITTDQSGTDGFFIAKLRRKDG